MPDPANLLRTPLSQVHEELGARMVDFFGWYMPVQYTGVIEEHRSVRRAAGLFDLSHMGEFVVSGPDAQANLQHLLSNDISELPPGKAQYSLLLNDKGGIVDDLLIYALRTRRVSFGRERREYQQRPGLDPSETERQCNVRRSQRRHGPHCHSRS